MSSEEDSFEIYMSQSTAGIAGLRSRKLLDGYIGDIQRLLVLLASETSVFVLVYETTLSAVTAMSISLL
jgi:hypothetical protein